MANAVLLNPYRPGAGHMPPFLAGRERERQEFDRLLGQDVILDNLVLTGLRGVGKTVLLDVLKDQAIQSGWRWVGADLSEATSISEERLALRLLTDLSVTSSSLKLPSTRERGIGFRAAEAPAQLGFEALAQLYGATPGLPIDKLKAVLEMVWTRLQPTGARGIIFAYDEAQNLDDHSAREEYPLSLLLDLFQSIQRKDIRFMLVLAGLPTLFPRLVESRTFAERMFRVVTLEHLTPAQSRDAIVKPAPAVSFSEEAVQLIIKESAGYPYFLQFICREVFDVLLGRHPADGEAVAVVMEEILRKLDNDFFAGRWARATERQQELLEVVARIDNADTEFSVQEAVKKSKEVLDKPFSPSHVSQMFAALSKAGLIYRNRHGRYSFALPLMGRFIRREIGLE